MRKENDPPLIELIYDRDCPNVERAREMITDALASVGAQSTWIEWDRDEPATPSNRREYGSPTVLVGGRDAGCGGNENPVSDANCCRIYIDEIDGIRGAPSARLIAEAIRGSRPA